MKLTSHGSTLNLSRPQVMGILNVTPDSFFDGGRYNKLNHALLHANQLILAGATIIDVGGESSRPGSVGVSEDEEISRVVPVIEAISKRFKVFISVDTSKESVIRESAKAGAHIINDIRALQQPGALSAAVNSGLLVCLMHMQGQPHTMQKSPNYNDLISDVKIFFKYHINRCQAAGLKSNKILIDPGFGFGKNLSHNSQLLARLRELRCFGLPMVVGMSRKSMVRQLLNLSIDQCVIGSVACAVIAAMHGAKIIRVHDVKETVEAMRVVDGILSAREYSK